MTSDSETRSTTPRTTSPSAKLRKLTSYMSSSRSYSSVSNAASWGSAGGAATGAAVAPLGVIGETTLSVFSMSGMSEASPPGFEIIRPGGAFGDQLPSGRITTGQTLNTRGLNRMLSRQRRSRELREPARRRPPAPRPSTERRSRARPGPPRAPLPRSSGPIATTGSPRTRSPAAAANASTAEGDAKATRSNPSSRQRATLGPQVGRLDGLVRHDREDLGPERAQRAGRARRGPGSSTGAARVHPPSTRARRPAPALRPGNPAPARGRPGRPGRPRAARPSSPAPTDASFGPSGGQTRRQPERRETRRHGVDRVRAREHEPLETVAGAQGVVERRGIGRRSDVDRRDLDHARASLLQQPHESRGLTRPPRHDDAPTGEARHALSARAAGPHRERAASRRAPAPRPEARRRAPHPAGPWIRRPTRRRPRARSRRRS